MTIKNLIKGIALTSTLLVSQVGYAGHAGYIMDDVKIHRLFPASNGSSSAYWVHYKTTNQTNSNYCETSNGFGKVKLVNSASHSAVQMDSAAAHRSFGLATSALLSQNNVHIYVYSESGFITSSDCTSGLVGGIELVHVE